MKAKVRIKYKLDGKWKKKTLVMTIPTDPNGWFEDTRKLSEQLNELVFPGELRYFQVGEVIT